MPHNEGPRLQGGACPHNERGTRQTHSILVTDQTDQQTSHDQYDLERTRHLCLA